MSLHFLFVVIPDRGHVFPNLSVVSELVRRDHRVTVITGESMAEVVKSSGATLLPYDAKYDKSTTSSKTSNPPRRPCPARSSRTAARWSGPRWKAWPMTYQT